MNEALAATIARVISGVVSSSSAASSSDASTASSASAPAVAGAAAVDAIKDKKASVAVSAATRDSIKRREALAPIQAALLQIKKMPVFLEDAYKAQRGGDIKTAVRTTHQMRIIARLAQEWEPLVIRTYMLYGGGWGGDFGFDKCDIRRFVSDETAAAVILSVKTGVPDPMIDWPTIGKMAMIALAVAEKKRAEKHRMFPCMTCRVPTKSLIPGGLIVTAGIAVAFSVCGNKDCQPLMAVNSEELFSDPEGIDPKEQIAPVVHFVEPSPPKAKAKAPSAVAAAGS